MLKFLILGAGLSLCSFSFAKEMNVFSDDLCIVVTEDKGGNLTSGEVVVKGTMEDRYAIRLNRPLCILVETSRSPGQLLGFEKTITKLFVPSGVSACKDLQELPGQYTFRGIIRPGAEGGVAQFTFECKLK